jgi:hypothetical protein
VFAGGEAKTLAALSHPNIAHAFSVDGIELTTSWGRFRLSMLLRSVGLFYEVPRISRAFSASRVAPTRKANDAPDERADGDRGRHDTERMTSDLPGSRRSIDTYRGLAQRSPLLALAMLVFLLSLGGIPFVAGFWAKLYIFLAAAERGMYGLVFLGAVLTVVALYYYLLVARRMYIEAPTRREPVPMPGLLGRRSRCAPSAWSAWGSTPARGSRSPSALPPRCFHTPCSRHPRPSL